MSVEWGVYQGRKRLPCSEDPTRLLGMPIGQYHCPICGMMILAGIPHISPNALAKRHPLYPLDHYEDEYEREWPPGYEAAP